MCSESRSILNALMLSPSEGKEAWRSWRARADLDKLEVRCLELLPTLSGRLSEWLAHEPEDEGKHTLLGICRRGWAFNQVRYRAAAGAVTTLRHAGVEPVAVFGSVAWALVYAEEKAVRPIEALDILIRRESVARAALALHNAGWVPEPGMPLPEGPILDRFRGIWFRSLSGTSLQLAWRLWDVSPELARANEAVPACKPVTIHGTMTFVLPTEELLLDALIRDQDHLVSWKCDAVVLLRNRVVNWGRLRVLARKFPAASGRLNELRREVTTSIPRGILDFRQPGPIGRRLSGIWLDYRQVCWGRGEEAALPGFATYLCKRLVRRTSVSNSERTS